MFLPSGQTWSALEVNTPKSLDSGAWMVYAWQSTRKQRRTHFFFATTGGSINSWSIFFFFFFLQRKDDHCSFSILCVLHVARAKWERADRAEDDRRAFDSYWGVRAAQKGALWRGAVRLFQHKHLYYPGSIREYSLWTYCHMTCITTVFIYLKL